MILLDRYYYGWGVSAPRRGCCWQCDGRPLISSPRHDDLHLGLQLRELGKRKYGRVMAQRLHEMPRKLVATPPYPRPATNRLQMPHSKHEPLETDVIQPRYG